MLKRIMAYFNQPFAYHGGAWKVAYADFVTAMMAFFLLLWLLSSADEATLDGIAEYFTPTIGIRDSMGIGFEGGESPEEDGVKKDNLTPPGVTVGAVPQGPIPNDAKRKALIEADQESNLFDKAEEALKQAFETDPNLRDISDNIIVEQSPEGLKIEVTDSDKYPMFISGSATLTDYGRRTLAKMLEVVEAMPNYISITGHTDATPFTGRANYSNWELSADRANAARRFLLKAGMEPTRPQKVVGQAASDPLLPEDPNAARNRRITIILLRGSYLDLEDWELPASRGLLAAPRAIKTRERAKEVIKEAEAAAQQKNSEENKEALPEYYQDRTLDRELIPAPLKDNPAKSPLPPARENFNVRPKAKINPELQPAEIKEEVAPQPTRAPANPIDTDALNELIDQ